MTLRLDFPQPIERCEKCTDIHYIDHDLIYCMRCHYPVAIEYTERKIVVELPTPNQWWRK